MHVDYWHGGAPGIRVGEFVEPPHTRQARLSPEERTKERVYALADMNRLRDSKRVYFTSDRELARAWAVNAYRGTLYRVRPVPPASLEVDPDFPDCGFSARRAEVIEVEEPEVDMTEDEAHRICSKHQKWSDHSPMYDADGYILPPPEHRKLGKTPADYRHFGRWFPLIGPLRLEPSGEIWAVQPPLDRTPPRWN